MSSLRQVLAMSSRSWLSYSYQSRFHLTPLSYETLEYASGFASEQCPEGIVAISTNTLRCEQDTHSVTLFTLKSEASGRRTEAAPDTVQRLQLCVRRENRV